jgi:hypothetical protein
MKLYLIIDITVLTVSASTFCVILTLYVTHVIPHNDKMNFIVSFLCILSGLITLSSLLTAILIYTNTMRNRRNTVTRVEPVLFYEDLVQQKPKIQEIRNYTIIMSEPENVSIGY